MKLSCMHVIDVLDLQACDLSIIRVSLEVYDEKVNMQIEDYYMLMTYMPCITKAFIGQCII